jgi:streptomycin 6-kinase
VLKVSPERRRVLDEAAALARWQTPHVPSVLALDEDAGVLVIEAIEPGTQLAEATDYPSLESLAALMKSLHAGPPDPSYPPVADRVAYLFEAGLKDYERRPDLAGPIPRALYERGRRLALTLAEGAPASVLLHGDLTPVNVLDGGEARGLVAIDAAPCLGDPAFDAVDLVLFRAADVETIAARAEGLAPAIRADAGRLFKWCAAFAAMIALEFADTSESLGERSELLVAFAEAET